MKRLLVSVAILLFATMLFVNERESESKGEDAKDEVALSSNETQMDS